MELWREAHFEVKSVKKWRSRTTFRSWDVEKSARRCGAKHISKSKCKAHQSRRTFESWDVEKVYAVVARSTFPSQNVQNTPCSDHFWKLTFRKSARRWANSDGFVAASTTTTTLHYTPLHCNYNYSYNYNYTTLHQSHYTTPHSTSQHYTTLNYTTPHYPTYPYITLRYTH